MIVDRNLRRQWQDALSVDFATPPAALVLRCISLLGTPDLVLSYRSPRAEGTEWEVIACSDDRIAKVTADSPHERWIADFIDRRPPNAPEIPVVITAMVRPLRTVAHVSALQGVGQGDYFIQYQDDESANTVARGGWAIEWPDGFQVVLGPQYTYGERAQQQEDTAHQMSTLR